MIAEQFRDGPQKVFGFIGALQMLSESLPGRSRPVNDRN